MYKIAFIPLLFIATLFSCKKKEQPIKTKADYIAELEASPDTIIVDDKIFVLQTSLVRNFMPICEENGDPLYAVVELIDLNHSNIQQNVILKSQYVINGGEFWNKLTTQQNVGYEYKVTGISDKGPKWGPDIDVDVVCEFEYQGVTRKILAKSQEIIAVY